MLSRTRRRLAGGACAAVAAVAAASPAGAATASRGQSTAQSVSSATWSAVITAASSSPYGTGAFTYTTTTIGVNTAYVSAVNTGTVPLSTSGFTVTYGLSVSSGLGLGVVNLSSCSTAWNITSGICSGTTTLLATLGSLTVPSSSPPRPTAVGSKVPLQVAFGGVGIGLTATVSVTVTRIAGQGVTTRS